MNSKKSKTIITVLLVFWGAVLAWGMFKATTKLLVKSSPAIINKNINKEKSTAGKQIKAPEKKLEAKASAVTKKKIIKEAADPGKNVKTEKQMPSPKAEDLLPQTPPIPVKAIQLKSSDFLDVLPVMGTIKGKTETALRFEINGVIKKIFFSEGQKIKKGDPIANLDPSDTEIKLGYSKNRLNAAKAALDSADKKLEIQRKLYEAGAIIKMKMEEAEFETESAKYQLETIKSELQLAENELKKITIYATKDGVMGPKEAEEGEFVTPQDKLGSYYEISEVFAEVGIVERDIDKIKLGQKAKVYVDAYPNITFEGSLENIFPVVEGKSRTLTAKIKINNPDSLLLPGMFSRVEILICELKEALMVPSTAIINAGEGITLVPVVSAQSLMKTEDESQIGTVSLARVKLGYVTGDYAQVIEGLKPQDLVVIETQGELKDGANVKILATEELSF